MQLAITLQHHRHPAEWGVPQYVRRLDMRGRRPAIVLNQLPTDCEDNTTAEDLDFVLSEIMAARADFTGYRIDATDAQGRTLARIAEA